MRWFFPVFASVLNDRLLTILVSLILGLILTFAASRKHFFKISKEETSGLKPLAGIYVVQAFACFLGISILLVPEFFEVWGLFPTTPEEEGSNVIRGSWQNILSTALNLIAYSFILFTLPPKDKCIVFGLKGYATTGIKKIKDYFNGAISWAIIYPWIIFAGQLISILVSFFYQGPEVDQAAVEHVKKVLAFPGIFALTALFIVTAVPLLEEILFRGFLQGWVKGILGAKSAILITSVVFSLFHFSPSQGIENIELLISLFLLSCCLGFLKERFCSIWASVGLHSTFNFMSMVMIYEPI